MPSLTIFAPTFLPQHLQSFDYDKRYRNIYNSLPDSDFRDKFAKDRTTKEFEKSISNHLKT